MLICTPTPAFTQWRMPCTARSHVPQTPRNRSCAAGSAESMLIATLRMPASRISRAHISSIRTPLVPIAIVRPFPVP